MSPHIKVNPTELLLKRVRTLNNLPYTDGTVVYYCVRDQRVDQNAALLFAQTLALKHKVPLCVLFVLYPNYLNACERQYDFMFRGLEEMEVKLRKLNIALYIEYGDDVEEIEKFIKKHKCGAVVTDFSPLKINRSWKDRWALHATVPIFEVDARNIIPAWIVSEKQEYGAYTIRPKIHKLLPEFLHPIPKVKKMNQENLGASKLLDWKKIRKHFTFNDYPKKVDWIIPGENAAQKTLDTFIQNGLYGYAEKRNDPNLESQSGLSPYITFGQISRHKIALDVLASKAPRVDKESFLEELIVRSEVAENFCFYNPEYDNPKGFPAWAQKTLSEHKDDAREYEYSLLDFEKAQTHDQLWNAAQQQLLQTGKMHGYMRMYWAKKILEWTKSPEEAMKIAIYLNDTYELDGREPNGYTGIAWSIGGVHDRAWFPRKVFGTIRFMSIGGAQTKFDVGAYIKKWTGIEYAKKKKRKSD